MTGVYPYARMKLNNRVSAWGPVEGVRCVVTGHTPVPEPGWHENVLGIDTGVHIDQRRYGRLTIARIDAKEIETWSSERVAEDAKGNAG